MLPATARTIGLALILGVVSSGGAERIVGIVVAGRPLDAGPAPRIIGETVFGPLAACARLAGADAQWDAAARTMTITAPGRPRVVVTAGKDTARIGNETVRLGRPVEVRQNVCYGPVARILEALGLRVRWVKGESFLLANAVLKGIEVRAGEGGARVTMRTNAPVQGEFAELDHPPRRYIDLPGVEMRADAPPTRYVYTGPLVRVRTGQSKSSPPTARVVADVVGDAPAVWEPAPDGRGGDIVIGDPRGPMAPVLHNLARLTDVTLAQPQAGVEMLRASLDWRVKHEWDVLIRPPRITLTFPEAWSRLPETTLPMRGEFIERVEITNDEDSPATTLTLHLRELMSFTVRETDAGGVEVAFVRGRLSDKTIVLDPGHGGKDKGAVGRVLTEKAVNLDVAMRTARRLRDLGARVFLTRTDDSPVGLYERPEIAQRLGADIFVSIHCNAMPRRNVGHGTETFYHHLESKCLGLLMQEALVRGLGRADRGLKRARFVVIRETSIPAVLVELMFLNSDEEEALLQQEDVREAAAASIVEGLREFVEGTGPAPWDIERAAGLSRR